MMEFVTAIVMVLMVVTFMIVGMKASVFGWQATVTNRLRHHSSILERTQSGEIEWNRRDGQLYTAKIGGENFHYSTITDYIYFDGSKEYPSGTSEEFMAVSARLGRSIIKSAGTDEAMELAEAAMNRL